jgi:hypothetical protein
MLGTGPSCRLSVGDFPIECRLFFCEVVGHRGEVQAGSRMLDGSVTRSMRTYTSCARSGALALLRMPSGHCCRAVH